MLGQHLRPERLDQLVGDPPLEVEVPIEPALGEQVGPAPGLVVLPPAQEPDRYQGCQHERTDLMPGGPHPA